MAPSKAINLRVPQSMADYLDTWPSTTGATIRGIISQYRALIIHACPALSVSEWQEIVAAITACGMLIDSCIDQSGMLPPILHHAGKSELERKIIAMPPAASLAAWVVAVKIWMSRPVEIDAALLRQCGAKIA